jgi:hypothetical protein
MRTKADDIGKQLLDTLASGDPARAAGLRRLVSLRAAKHTQLRRDQAEAAVVNGKDSAEVKRIIARREAEQSFDAVMKRQASEAARAAPEVDANAFLIYGVVVDKSGDPVVGVAVTAIDSQRRPVVHDCTDESGHFKLAVSAQSDKAASPIATPGTDATTDTTATQKPGVTLDVTDAKTRVLYRGAQKYPIVAGSRQFVSITIDPSKAFDCPAPVTEK